MKTGDDYCIAEHEDILNDSSEEGFFPSRKDSRPEASPLQHSMGYFPDMESVIADSITIMEHLAHYLKVAGYPNDLAVVVRERDITDISVRIEKRAEYYRHFHDIEISEAKRAALMTYWIAKLRPFTVVDERYSSSDKAAMVNEWLAAYILVFSTCIAIPDDEIARLEFKSGYMRKLVYSFRYRSLEIDALVMLAEGLTPESFQQVFGEEI